METRVDKYNDESTSMSRTKKNQQLYSEINELQMDTFDVNSNSAILSKDGKTIDIDRLKDMLDKRYREDVKKKSLGEIDEDEEREKINLAETREYDINEIISKAKENKQDDYEIERLKKLRNTQVDILSQLNIEALGKIDDRVKAVSDSEKDELKTLIDTINLTEETNAIKNDKEMDPLDILGDLKGDDDTKIEGVGEFTNEIIKQAKAAEKEKKEEKEKTQEIKKEEKEKTQEIKEEKKEDTKNIKTTTLDKSFYTNSTKFKTQDFDDFGDLKDEMSATKVIIRILIILIIIAFIGGVVFLLNSVLNWGLF